MSTEIPENGDYATSILALTRLLEALHAVGSRGEAPTLVDIKLADPETVEELPRREVGDLGHRIGRFSVGRAER